MKLVFFAGRSLPTHARTLEERPLGGTETALIRLTEILSRRGHDVTVLTSHPSPPPSTPMYLPAAHIYEIRSCDAFISVQDWRPLMLDIGAKKKYFWTGDSFDQFANWGLGEKRVHPQIDRFLAVSDWHAQSLCDESGFPFHKSFVIRNGVNLSDFSGTETRNRMRVIYSSNPRRGLRYVPELFAALKKKHPQLELHIFSAINAYDSRKPANGPDAVPSEKMAEMLRSIPDTYIHGNILQHQLAREFMKSGLLFYPNSYLETSCITAMEAMAAGCPVVTTAAGALPETVRDGGLLISGTPGTVEYGNSFIEAVDKLLSNEELWRAYSERARERAFREFSWEACADRFEKVLAMDLMDVRPHWELNA